MIRTDNHLGMGGFLLFLKQLEIETPHICNNGVSNIDAIEHYHEGVITIGEQVLWMMQKQSILLNHRTDRVFEDDSALILTNGDNSIFEPTIIWNQGDRFCLNFQTKGKKNRTF